MEKYRLKRKPFSEEWKVNISKSKLGTEHSIITKNKIRSSIINNKYTSKTVVDLLNSIIYDSIKEAAISKNIKQKTLSAQLNGQNKNKFNLIKL